MTTMSYWYSLYLIEFSQDDAIQCASIFFETPFLKNRYSLNTDHLKRKENAKFCKSNPSFL